MIKHFLDDESGATAIEYGLIAALISVVIIAIVTQLGETIEETFTEIDTGLQAANDSNGGGGAP